MQVNLEMIYTRMQEEAVAAFSFYCGNRTITGAGIFPEDNEIARESGHLLVGTLEELLELDGREKLEGISVIAVDTQHIFQQQSGPASYRNACSKLDRMSEYLDYLIVQGGNVREWISKANRIIERYQEQNQNLMLSVIREEPLSEILGICSEIMDNPVILYDSGMNVIAVGGNCEKLIEDSEWRETLEKGYLSEHFIKNFKESGGLRSAGTTHRTAYINPGNGGLPSICCNLYHEDEKFAVFAVVETDIKLLPVHSILLEYLKELIYRRVFSENRQHKEKYSQLKNMLTGRLQGQSLEPGALNYSLKQQRWGREDGFYLLKVQMSKEDVATDMQLYVINLIEKVLKGCIPLQLGSDLYFIFNEKKTENFEEKLVLVNEKLVKYKLNSSVSYRFPDIINIYEQAYLTTAAIRLGTRIDREKYFYPYSKYRIIHIMDILAEKIDLKLLCNPEILHLHENDKDGILMQSFYVYMKENMSLSKAAEILNIHKSTLGYRLLKVERMVTLNLNDSDVRQSILLSCEILQYLNTYK